MSDFYPVDTEFAGQVQASTRGGRGAYSEHGENVPELMIFDDGRVERMGFFEMLGAMESGQCVTVIYPGL